MRIMPTMILVLLFTVVTGVSRAAHERAYVPKVGDTVRVVAYCESMKSLKKLMDVFRAVAGPAVPKTPRYKAFMRDKNENCHDHQMTGFPWARGTLVGIVEKFPVWKGHMVIWKFKLMTGEDVYAWAYVEKPSTSI